EALRVAAGHGPHGRLLGPLLDAAASAVTPSAADARDRERRRHDRPRLRALLSARRDRRSRARPEAEPGRAPLVRRGRQPAHAPDLRGRAAVPGEDARTLRPDRGRRLPPAVRALLPRDAGVLPSRSPPPRTWRRDRAQR